MMSGVLRTREHFEVQWVIIELVPVDMMHRFFYREGPPYFCFRHYTMFENLFSVVTNSSIPESSDRSPLPPWVCTADTLPLTVF